MIGIYKIENKINHKCYIGQSNNLNQRINNHLWALKNNRHQNSYLQYSWNKYGENNFTIEIVEECKLSELSEKEMYYIDLYDSYNNGYNHTLGGEGNTQLTIEKVKPICDMFNTGKYSTNDIAKYFNMDRKRVCRYLYFGNINDLCNYDPTKSGLKKVICLTTNRIFESIKVAEDYYKIHGVAACCKHKHDYAGIDKDKNILIWMYLDEYETYTQEDINLYILNILKKHDYRVICLNTKKMFANTKEASLWVGLKNHQEILLCCNDKINFAGKNKSTREKYVWRYYKDYILLNEKEIQNIINTAQTYSFEKSVICLNTKEEFNSPKIASLKYNCDKEDIKKCCRKQVAFAGFKDDMALTWMYIEDYKNAPKEIINKKLFYCKIQHIPSPNEKMIICLNNLFVFQNQQEAGKWCNLGNPSQIGYGIRNNYTYIGKHPETKEKLKWMYYEDYIKNNKSVDNLYDYNGILQYE